MQGKRDRPDEAFLFERSTYVDPHDRHAEKLRQELTLPRMDDRTDLQRLAGN